MTVRHCCDSTVRGKCTTTSVKVLKRAIRKCLSVMRQKLTINKKMLSVVSAGAAAGMGGMDRLRGGGGGGGTGVGRAAAAAREQQLRLHSMRTDFAVDLPPSIGLPDGEHDHHSLGASRLLHLRDPDQESEIYQKCIRPPPNRTVLESESPPPYRSHSAGVLSTSTYSSTNSTSSASSTSSTTSGGGAGCAHSADWSSSGCASLVVRCHSMSSSTGAHRTTPHGASSNAAVAPQKTDFLQRTVKILTGGGKKAHQPQPPPAPTLSVVVVPRRSEAQRHKLTPPQSGV